MIRAVVALTFTVTSLVTSLTYADAPPARAPSAVDVAKCQAWSSAKQGSTLPGIQLTLSSVPRLPHNVEGADLTARRQMTNQIRDLAAVYQQCSPKMPPDPRMSDPAYRAAKQAGREDSERHREANIAAIVDPAVNWATDDDAAIDKELACRTVPQCLTDRSAAKEAARVANLLSQVTARACALTRQRADDVRTINAERANPSGVANLTVLHDAGADIQSIDPQMPQLKAQYATLAHKAFNPTVCQ